MSIQGGSRPRDVKFMRKLGLSQAYAHYYGDDHPPVDAPLGAEPIACVPVKSVAHPDTYQSRQLNHQCREIDEAEAICATRLEKRRASTEMNNVRHQDTCNHA